MKQFLIAFIIVELIGIMCVVNKVPFNPYGYIWIIVSVALLIGIEKKMNKSNKNQIL